MLNQGLGKVSAEFRRGDRVHGKPQSDRWCVYDTNESQMGGEARRAQAWRVFLCVEDGGMGPGSCGSSPQTQDTQAFAEVASLTGGVATTTPGFCCWSRQ